MQSRCFLHVIFALSSLILSKAQDVIRSGHSCLRSSPAADGLTRVTFLREGKAGVRSLYLTMWSGDMRLVTCEVNTDPVVTEGYRALCDGRGTQAQEISHRFNISTLLSPDAPCALVSSSAPKFSRRTRRDETEGKTRRKRWIFPGTLWCGTGSKAGRYDELGMFESADRCCREHDHCPHMIPAFTVNYGVFNSKFFTVSHCDCDQRFRQCLLDVNDTISSMVGYSFFSILQVPCFELKLQKRCTQMYWWGMCKVAKDAPYAVFQSPLPFNSTEDNADSDKSTSRFKIPLRGDTFQPRCKSCPERNTTSHMKTVAPSTTTNQLLIKGTKLETLHLKNTPGQILWNTATSATQATSQLKSATSIHKVGKPQKQMDSHLLWKNTSQELLDSQLLCRSLKHLDDCKYKIRPLEKKYDLQNTESKTAFHCDCTSRLAAQIESFKQSSILPTLLTDFISQRCFKLPKEKKCHGKKRCSGGFSKASDLLRALKKIEEKDTAGVRNSGNDRKRGIPVRLYKRCLRLEREVDIMAQLKHL
ncbi:Group 3 secretory phospholipase A2 [Collichthys lucidus]|uniref:phospholipase A2 n=1 Tax=Collichthys lucidus TaxID=240159 RepID=A0A4U5UV83_COLLU|nr:Group 3 secretory phospholipase A2 [Collichthys lucidus]